MAYGHRNRTDLVEINMVFIATSVPNPQESEPHPSISMHHSGTSTDMPPASDTVVTDVAASMRRQHESI